MEISFCFCISGPTYYRAVLSDNHRVPLCRKSWLRPWPVSINAMQSGQSAGRPVGCAFNASALTSFSGRHHWQLQQQQQLKWHHVSFLTHCSRCQPVGRSLDWVDRRGLQWTGVRSYQCLSNWCWRRSSRLWELLSLQLVTQVVSTASFGYTLHRPLR